MFLERLITCNIHLNIEKSLLPTYCVTKRSTCSLFICTVYMCIHPEHLGLFSRGKPDVFRMYVHMYITLKGNNSIFVKHIILKFHYKTKLMFKHRYVWIEIRVFYDRAINARDIISLKPLLFISKNYISP